VTPSGSEGEKPHQEGLASVSMSQLMKIASSAACSFLINALTSPE